MEISIQAIIEAVIEQQNLTDEQMTDVMQAIMTGQITDAQIAALLVALRIKGETVTEISAAAKVMASLAMPCDIKGDHVVDIVGTGGDCSNTFNISTATAIIVAACGGVVAKHGNRSVSSRSGSADVLEALGVNIALNAEQVQRCAQQIGIGFLFAPTHHSAMKYAKNARQQIGVRTMFNLLGPLTNPAKAAHQLIGVFDNKWLMPVAQVLQSLGSEHALVVHSADGLDEISIAAETYVAELYQGQIKQYTINPEQFALQKQALDDLRIESAQQSAELIKQVLNNQSGAALDIVRLNSGAALYSADLCDSIAVGIDMASKAIEQGKAMNKLQQLIKLSNTL